MTPRVSLVVPTYNNESFIVETMRSLLAQTYDDFEVVVADHGSTDRTWELLEDFAGDPRVRLLRTDAGGGAERNWNRATQAARGELVKLVCGDDLLAPECLAVQVAALDQSGPRTAMVASTRDVIDAAGRPVLHGLGLGGLTGRVPGTAALRRGVIKGANIFGEPCCVLLRSSVLESAGGWHGDPGYLIDQATYSRVLLLGDLVAVPRSLASFRVSASQWSVRLARQQASAAAEFHRQLDASAPGVLRRSDVWRGNVRARIRAAERRVLYVYLGRRMKAPVTDRA